MSIFDIGIELEENQRPHCINQIQGQYGLGCPPSTTSGSAECQILQQRITTENENHPLNAALFYHLDDPNVYSFRSKMYLENNTYIAHLFHAGGQLERDSSFVDFLYLNLGEQIRQVQTDKFSSVCLWQYTIYNSTDENSIDLENLIVKLEPETNQCKYRQNETIKLGCTVKSSEYIEKEPITITKTQYGLIAGLTIGGFTIVAIILFLVWWKSKKRIIRSRSKLTTSMDRSNQHRMTEVNPDFGNESEDEKYDNWIKVCISCLELCTKINKESLVVKLYQSRYPDGFYSTGSH